MRYREAAGQFYVRRINAGAIKSTVKMLVLSIILLSKRRFIMNWVIEVFFSAGLYAQICRNIKEVCAEIRRADESTLKIDLIRAYQYLPGPGGKTR